ncbi:MAG: PD40 domain-containing protein, partial [Gemmatimonadales bacterium]|nr:PD40 domain-containing protein [Gemmatimonadales bacterium]
MAVDDLLQREELGTAIVSPDGEWIAVVVVRSEVSAANHRDVATLAQGGGDRTDIWLVGRRGGAPRNLTNGTTDGSGYWNPVWSPDGRRLAFLSTKGGDEIRPYVYDIASGRLQRLSERGVDPKLQALSDEAFLSYALLWRDSVTVLCALRAENMPAPLNSMSRVKSYASASAGWEKAMAGRMPTVSVLWSGREVPAEERPQGQLVSIDVRTAEISVLATGNVRNLHLSPNQRHLAVLVEVGRRPPDPLGALSLETVQVDLPRTRLAIVDLRRKRSETRWIDGVRDPKPDWYGDTFRQWAPDGASFAVIGRARDSERSSETLFVVQAATGRVEAFGAKDLVVRGVAWTSGGDLLALARSRTTAADSAGTTRLDWWAFDRAATHRPRNLTAKLATVPSSLLPTPDRHEVVGVAAGKLWSLSVSSATGRQLLEGLPLPVEELIWPPPRVPRLRAIPPVALLVRLANQELVAVHLRGSAICAVALPRPSTQAHVASYRPEEDLVVFAADQGDGTFLWTTDGVGRQVQQRLALNTYLADIADAQRLVFSYRGSDGDSLKALVLLPPAYHPGVRLPLVTDVYAGRLIGDSGYQPGLEKWTPALHNLHLLAARGHAVLVPSMPLAPWGSAS